VNRTLICAGLLGSCLLAPTSGFAAQGAAKLSWADIVAGIRFERERLHSGIYTAVGTENVPGFEGELPVRLYSVFSMPDKHIRFEHRGARPKLNGDTGEMQDTFRCIHSAADRTEHYTSLPKSRMLNIVAPGTMRVKGRDGTRGYLDPRCLGIVAIHKLYDGLPFDKIGSDWADKMSAAPAQVFDEGDGIVRATILEKGARDSYWVDTKHGFTLIRHLKEAGMVDQETGEFSRLMSAIEKNEAFRKRVEEAGIDWRARSALEVPEEVDVTWKELNGVWVPTSYRHVIVHQVAVKGQPASKSIVSRQEVSLSLDWTQANTPIEERLFDYHDFNLPIGTEVFDQRGKDVQFIEKIGSLPASVPVTTALTQSSRRGLIIAINITGLAIIIAVLLMKRKATPAPPGTRS